MTEHLLASAGLVDTVDTASRTLSGLVLPVGELGLTSVGEVVVSPTADIVWPADLSTVKLISEHTPDGAAPVPVGYCTAVRRTPQGWRASFHVPETPAGDEALMLAGARLRDSFSVELYGLSFDARDELVAASVSRVAHVTTPAFPSARHDGMAASMHHPQEGSTMLTAAQIARLNELLAMDQLTDDDASELRALLDIVNGALGDEDESTEDESTEDESTEDESTEDDDEQPPARASLAASRRLGGARRPQRQQLARARSGAPRRRAGRHDISELYAAQARVLSGRSRPELEAALSDITLSGNIWALETGYAGQLWSGLTYERQYVQNSTPDDLTAPKGVGWRWVVKPEVADYAGDKADVPSNAPTTEDAEWNAARLAGAHDIDRALWDFGQTEYVEAYYAAMREDYARKSDAKARLFQIASAVADAGAETSLFRAAAVASNEVVDATGGATPDWFYISSADSLSLLDLTEADIPAYLEVFGVTPEKFKPTPGVAAGTVIAGVRQATKFRELSGSPIRVEAISISDGGINGGVFGYYATELVMPGGIVSKTFA